MKVMMRALLIGALVAGGVASTPIDAKDKRPKKSARTPTVGNRVPILLSETSALPDPNLATVPVLIPEPVENADWGQPGGSPSKVMGQLALGDKLTPVWHQSVRGNTNLERLAAAPVVGDGKLFVMDTHAVVHAFDAKTGASLWSVTFGAPDSKRIIYGGGVSFDGGFLYVTNGVGDVGALKASDGSLVWKKHPSGPVRGAPSIGDGLVYVTTVDNQLYALKTVDGSTEWSANAALELAGVFGTAAPAVAQGTVVQGFSSGELNAYRYENGRSLWGDALSRTSISTSVSALADIDADPVIDRGRVFAIGAGGRMVSVDLVSGQRIWEANIAGLSTPAVAGEWIFVVADDAKLHCIARATGKIRWTLLLPHNVKNKPDKEVIRWYGPVLAGGRLILTSTTGLIAEVFPGDGSLKSMGRGSGPMSFGPIVAGKMLYTFDNAGRLTAWR